MENPNDDTSGETQDNNDDLAREQDDGPTNINNNLQPVTQDNSQNDEDPSTAIFARLEEHRRMSHVSMSASQRLVNALDEVAIPPAAIDFAASLLNDEAHHGIPIQATVNEGDNSSASNREIGSAGDQPRDTLPSQVLHDGSLQPGWSTTLPRGGQNTVNTSVASLFMYQYRPVQQQQHHPQPQEADPRLDAQLAALRQNVLQLALEDVGEEEQNHIHGFYNRLQGPPPQRGEDQEVQNNGVGNGDQDNGALEYQQRTGAFGDAEELSEAPALQQLDAGGTASPTAPDDTVVEALPDNAAKNASPFLLRLPMASPSDKHHFSPFDSLARQQMEFFACCQDDTNNRVGPIVGIQCRHCAEAEAPTDGHYQKFPTQLDTIEETAKELAKVHLCEACPTIPQDIKHELLALLLEQEQEAGTGSSCADTSNSQDYWAESARCQGIVETEEGLCLTPHLN